MVVKDYTRGHFHFKKSVAALWPDSRLSYRDKTRRAELAESRLGNNTRSARERYLFCPYRKPVYKLRFNREEDQKMEETCFFFKVSQKWRQILNWLVNTSLKNNDAVILLSHQQVSEDSWNCKRSKWPAFEPALKNLLKSAMFVVKLLWGTFRYRYQK